LGLEALREIIEGEIQPDKVEMAIIPTKTKKFRKLPSDDITKYIKQLSPKAPAKPR
jgi:20S proteasome alpha/beta subunit